MPSPDERTGPQYEYLLDLLNADLPTLVVNYDAFETRVENDVFMLFCTTWSRKVPIPRQPAGDRQDSAQTYSR